MLELTRWLQACGAGRTLRPATGAPLLRELEAYHARAQRALASARAAAAAERGEGGGGAREGQRKKDKAEGEEEMTVTLAKMQFEPEGQAPPPPPPPAEETARDGGADGRVDARARGEGKRLELLERCVATLGAYLKSIKAPSKSD